MIQVDRIMRRGVDDGVFPGAVLRVGRGENVLFHAAYGHANRFTGEPVTPGTVFDLASLTKPLATTLAVMRLCQQRRLGVEQRLASVLPAFEGSGKGGVTIAQLLAHTSGLPDHQPFYLELAARPAPERKNLLRARLVQEPLLCAPGERMLYSDLDFMILEWVVETVSGRRLDRYAAEEVYAPLGAADALFFIDLDRPAPPRACAATEQCPWRGRLIEAEVHDENAHALGGIAGHAGLFGTAERHVEAYRELMRRTLADAGREAVGGSGAGVRVRIPVIPGVNDDEANLRVSGAFLAGLNPLHEVELLPYHAIAAGKYAALGREDPLPGLQPPGEAHMRWCVGVLGEYGIRVVL